MSWIFLNVLEYSGNTILSRMSPHLIALAGDSSCASEESDQEEDWQHFSELKVSLSSKFQWVQRLQFFSELKVSVGFLPLTSRLIFYITFESSLLMPITQQYFKVGLVVIQTDKRRPWRSKEYEHNAISRLQRRFFKDNMANFLSKVLLKSLI